jgi:regulator of sigma E protease
MGFFENTLAFVFVLGVMVLIHELGHFIAARYFDVKVESFAFGFGPRLFGFRRGGTDYKVCLLPLGGYVKMAGEAVGEPTGDPGEFLSKPRWQRIIIAAMGPIFNFVLAIVLLVGLYMVHFERPAFFQKPPEVAYIEKGSSAARAGVQPGDLIVSIDGSPTPDWESVQLATVASAHLTMDLVVERDGRQVHLTMPLDADSRGIGHAGWTEAAPVRLGRSTPGMPAAQADIEPEDLLVAINGEPIRAVAEVTERIQQSGGNRIDLTLERDGRIVETSVTPVLDSSLGEDAWRIGVELRPEYETVVTSLEFGSALRQSLDDNRKNATLIFKVLGGLIEQRMSPQTLEGPIGIARLSGQAARRGWADLVALMAVISLNLGILNLLPIPILDGGVILMLLLESVIRRDISIAIKERIMQLGFVFLVLLFAFVIYNDILKSLPSG